ncbi:MAG: hypothetical protein JXA54_09310 [Candidatus Heimdallarchaeota archaeon]|nr:hypothetical protein [Candidatus Heimdallarchaeota archaeon]
MVELYTGKLNHDVCVVCKFELKENQVIYQCQICQALFHEDHLNEWLQKSSSCPVCKNSLTDKLNKDQMKQIEDQRSFAQNINFENEHTKNKKNLIIEKIVMFSFGFAILGLLAFILSEIRHIDYILKWYQIIGSILAFLPITYLIIIFFYFAIRKDFWEKITFTKEKVIIHSRRKPNVKEISLEQITNIEIGYITEKITPRDGKDQISLVKLLIKTNNSKLDLSTIKFFDFEEDALEFSKNLNAEFLKIYHDKSSVKQIEKKKTPLKKTLLYLFLTIGIPLLALFLIFFDYIFGIIIP